MALLELIKIPIQSTHGKFCERTFPKSTNFPENTAFTKQPKTKMRGCLAWLDETLVLNADRLKWKQLKEKLLLVQPSKSVDSSLITRTPKVNSSPKAVSGQRYPCSAWVVGDLSWEGAGQRPGRGQSPVEHRGTFVRPSWRRGWDAIEGWLKAFKSLNWGLRRLIQGLRMPIESLRGLTWGLRELD